MKKKSVSSLFSKTTKVRQHEVKLHPVSVEPARLSLVRTTGILASRPVFLSALQPIPCLGVVGRG